MINEDSDSYIVLQAISDSVFYFLPILLAYTAAKRFKCNGFTSIAIAGVLLYPSLTTLLEQKDAAMFFGVKFPSVLYAYSVIPIIIAIVLQSIIEKYLNLFLPEVLRGFLTPLCAILFVSYITLWILGPMGKYLGDGLANGYQFLYQLNPVIAGICIGSMIQIGVMFGFHWSLVPVAMNNISNYGSDTLIAFFAPAAFAVSLKTKDKKIKTLAFSSAISACFGVTEPAMYGVNLPLKRPMIAVCIAGGVGGGIVSFSGSSAISFAFPSIATLPIFWGEGFFLLITACLISMVLAFLITFFSLPSE